MLSLRVKSVLLWLRNNGTLCSEIEMASTLEEKSLITRVSRHTSKLVFKSQDLILTWAMMERTE